MTSGVSAEPSDVPYMRSSNLLVKERPGTAHYEFTDEPPFPEYLGKRP